MDFGVEVSGSGGRVVVRLAGELDIGTAPEVERVMAAIDPDTVEQVSIDLAKLTFCDCAGIGVIIGAHNRLARNGHRLVLVHPRPSVERVLTLTQCEWLLDSGSPPRMVG